MTKSLPSRNTGAPVSRNADTVKLAVQSIMMGTMKSPNGTARNRNPNGKMSNLATRSPAIATIVATIIDTSAKYVTTLASAKTPSNQRKPAAITPPNARIDGAAGYCDSSCRRFHMSQATMGAMAKPCSYVPELAQRLVICATVSR